MREITPIWDNPPVTQTPSLYKETEEERWMALFYEPSPYSLTANPTRYGPLTPQGFSKAKVTERIEYNAKWPEEPAAVASLLIAVGADETNVPSLIREYRRGMSHKNWEPLRSFETLLIFLKQTGVQPQPKHLLSLLENFSWSGGYSRVDTTLITNSLGIMREFCTTAEDSEIFLKAWLPTLKTSGLSGVSKISPALAAAFPDCSADAIVTWCKQYDDHQGLGYLVWQQRYPFHEWLVEIARSEPTTLDVRRERLQTLMALLSNMQDDLFYKNSIETECKVFAKVYESEVSGLIRAVTAMLKTEDHSSREVTTTIQTDFESELGFQWMGTLCALGLVPHDHPEVTKWLDGAFQHLDTRCGYLKTSPIGASRTTLNTGWFDKWSETVANLSNEWCNYLGRRVVLDLGTTDPSAELKACRAENWLKKADLGDTIIARSFDRNGGSLGLFMALVPYVSIENLPFMGSRLALGTRTSSVNARSLRTAWKQVDADRFGPKIPNEFSTTDTHLLLYALTRQDPRDILVTMKELGVDHRNPAFLDSLETWLTTTLKLSSKKEVLPEIDFNNLLL